MVRLFLIVFTPGGGRGPARKPVSPAHCNLSLQKNETLNAAHFLVAKLLASSPPLLFNMQAKGYLMIVGKRNSKQLQLF